MPIPPWAIFIIAVGLLGFIIFYKVVLVLVMIYKSRLSAQRREQLIAWAHGKGLDFDASRDGGMADRFDNFKCLQHGCERYAYNRMEGEWAGRPITAFDYHYATGVDDDRSHFHFSAVIITSAVPLEPLCICREGFLDKLTEFLGFEDIDFESAEFNRKFRVRSPFKRWAYDVVHTRTMEHLLSGPDVGIQLDFMYIIAWGRCLFTPTEFAAAADLIGGILDRLPEYVVKQQTNGP